jgi:hypothetical protein
MEAKMWLLIILFFDTPVTLGSVELSQTSGWQTHSEMEWNSKSDCEAAIKNFHWPEGMMGTAYCVRK